MKYYQRESFLETFVTRNPNVLFRVGVNGKMFGLIFLKSLPEDCLFIRCQLSLKSQYFIIESMLLQKISKNCFQDRKEH